MLDNNDKVLWLVEYDVKSVSAIVICGCYFWPPQDRQRSTTGGGVEDINWGEFPNPQAPTPSLLTLVLGACCLNMNKINRLSPYCQRPKDSPVCGFQGCKDYAQFNRSHA